MPEGPERGARERYDSWGRAEDPPRERSIFRAESRELDASYEALRLFTKTTKGERKDRKGQRMTRIETNLKGAHSFQFPSFVGKKVQPSGFWPFRLFRVFRGQAKRPSFSSRALYED